MKPPPTIVQYTPVFEANKAAYDSGKYRVISNQGSMRSGKTYGICQLLITIAITSKKKISVVSESLPHLKRGAMKDVLEILDVWGLYKEADHNKTDHIYKFPKTGSYIEFFGVDDPAKMRGSHRDILFINEANLIPLSTYQQLGPRTFGTIFIDFNPADDFSWVYDITDKPVKDGHKPNKFIHSTYQNNRHFLTQDLINDIESYQEADENFWRVFGLGLRGTSTETIFTHYKVIDDFPQCDQLVFGVDFGHNHPNAVVKVGELDGAIYWDQQIYEKSQTPLDLIYACKVLGITGNMEMYADSARPDTIQMMNNEGLWVKPADKSVWDGIQFIKSKKLYITKNSVDLLRELRNYKWKKKNDRTLDEPVKLNDDAIDAARYATYTHFNTPLIQYAGATY